MARKLSTTTEDSSDPVTPATGVARTVAATMKPLEQVQHDVADRLQPALKLSELINTSAMKTAAEQVRASLQLPQLASLTEQATEAATVAARRLADPASARDRARAAASVVPAHIEYRSALPSPLTGDTALSIAIMSAQDMGRLVREARRQRKLSQQAFADLVGVGRRFISELENGKATLEFDKVLQVASASGIDMLARRRR